MTVIKKFEYKYWIVNMKTKTPPPLDLTKIPEQIYMKPPTPKDQNGNKLVTAYAVTRIIRDIKEIKDISIVSMTPVTPVTPHTPTLDNKFYHLESKNYYLYHLKHTLIRPIKNSAPAEAPPLVPVKVQEDVSLEESNIYAIPEENSNNMECIALITELFI
ncbi:MAG: hypothetical protein O7C56_08395 [Rickettsia endosymbiont of Ixodes persulcatus]|nr:hypothetical protein [Rickettsia endosymbiont of Ixodes persulcatus]